MPTYTVRDPQTGKTVRLTGASPPSEAELTQIFGRLAPVTEPVRTPGRARGPATIGEIVGDVGIGAAKGVANTVAGLGELVHRIPGVTPAVDALYGRPVSQEAFAAARRVTQPTTPAQRVGYTVEQMGEFFLPTGATKLKLASEAAKSAVLTLAQSGSPATAATSAGLTAVIPGAGAVRRGAQALRESAEPLVQAALKPTLASLKRITGAGGLDAKATALVRFIIDRKLTTPEKARQLFAETEHELQRVLRLKNAPTDAATRADRYLRALERSASKQGLAADDVAQINKAAAELVEGAMGRDVITMVSTPHPTLLTAQGTPILVLRPKVTRALRPDVPATEALESARASSRWTTRKAWGEQKGATTESAKAVERAQRDAVKEAVPDARRLLQTEAKSLQSADALERMAQRTGNRDAVSLPTHVIAAGELATGRVPVLAFAANWLRNNQMKAGIWADVLGRAIEKGNAPLAADILKKLGVGGASQVMRPATAR
jgi:hypothetical protein